MSRLSYHKKAERWDVWEVSCHGPEEGNPFAEHWMKGSFSCDKETVDADGFYDGGLSLLYYRDHLCTQVFL